MFLIIDGYNLLHASGILGRGRGPGFLERSRQALLNFLVESLDEKALSRCTVVFDASSENVPRGRPRITTHRGITVQYASGMPSADELIEELILKHSSPRKLTIVSSDHRLHRAAKRRKATPVDSDVWFNQVLRGRNTRIRNTKSETAKPGAPTTQYEVDWWLKQFGFAPPKSVPEPSMDKPSPHAPRSNVADDLPPSDQKNKSPKRQPPRKSRKPPSVSGDDNPFPPGYGEDVLDEI